MAQLQSIIRRAVIFGTIVAGIAIIHAGRASAQVEAPVFSVTARDIARIQDLGGRLHIALNGQASARFSKFTAEHIGKEIRITAGDTVLNEAVVRIEIDSGLFSSRLLDDETRRHVKRLLIGP